MNLDSIIRVQDEDALSAHADHSYRYIGDRRLYRIHSVFVILWGKTGDTTKHIFLMCSNRDV